MPVEEVKAASLDDLKQEQDRTQKIAVACLTQSMELSRELDRAVAAARGGSAVDAARIFSLARETAEADRKTKAAEEDLRKATADYEHHFAAEAHKKRVADFHAAVLEVATARTEVIEHTRQASLALARVHDSRKKAVDLLNQLGGASSPQKTFLDEVGMSVDPYSGWAGVTFLLAGYDDRLYLRAARKI
jgi:hypothetical protein